MKLPTIFLKAFAAGTLTMLVVVSLGEHFASQRGTAALFMDGEGSLVVLLLGCALGAIFCLKDFSRRKTPKDLLCGIGIYMLGAFCGVTVVGIFVPAR